MLTETKAGNFQEYANVYDSLYYDKDYASECDILENIFKRFGHGTVESILDLGCGTGGHAIPLARRGYQVLGIDRSDQMLANARQKAKAANLFDNITFETANVQNFKTSQTFDSAICMFAVLSYQISNHDLFSTICAARQHVKDGGLFIGDFWYGPAVLKQRPEERVKRVQDGNDSIIRIVKPEIDTLRHTVNVDYDIIQLSGDRVTKEIQERHSMRFIFKPEIEFYLKQAGFNLEHFCPFANLDKEVNESTWNVMTISRAI